MPYFLGAPFLAGVPFLLDVNFATWAAGFYDADAFEAEDFTAPDKAKLTLTRDYSAALNGRTGQGETVQTSASTLLRSAVATQTDVACVGRLETSRPFGLVVQPCRFNHSPDALDASTVNAPRDLRTTTGWEGGIGSPTITQDYAASPDQSGTGCSRVEVSSGGASTYGNNDNVSGTLPITWSTWQRSTSSSDMFQVYNNNSTGSGAWDGTTRGASTTWARLVTLSPAGSGTRARCYAVDGRDYTGGPGATARDVLVDYTNFEINTHPTEAIPTARGTRPVDKLAYATGSELLATNGQIKVYAKLTPKHASTDASWFDNGNTSGAQDYWTLFAWGTSNQNYARIKDSDKKLYVRIANGTEVVSSNAIAFAQYDEVEIQVEVGMGIASVARYRVNGGSWNDLGLGTVSDTPSPGSGEIVFFSQTGHTTDSGFLGNTRAWSAWVHRLTVFDTNGPEG